MFCSPDEGAAAVILCRADLASKYTTSPIYLRASAVRTRRFGAFEVHSPWLPLESADGPTVHASRAAYDMAGIDPEDVDIAQLQDTDAGAEVIHMAENGFCADGEQEALVADGDTEIGGRMPVNTDGGLIANGEPIGASGLRQIHELVLPAPRDGRRAPGPRVTQGRVRAALRCARHRRRQHRQHLTGRGGWLTASPRAIEAAQQVSQQGQEKLARDGKLPAACTGSTCCSTTAPSSRTGCSPTRSSRDLPADGVVTGSGHVDGRPVVVVANDPTVKAGSWGAADRREDHPGDRARARRGAARSSGWSTRPAPGSPTRSQLFPGRRGAGRIFYNQVRLSGRVAPDSAASSGRRPPAAPTSRPSATSCSWSRATPRCTSARPGWPRW